MTGYAGRVRDVWESPRRECASQSGVRLLPPWQGGLVFTAWAAVLACGRTVITARRDIT